MIEQQSLISIIVPLYNVEQYMDRCIESIVNQTYKNLEIILVNDGSPDLSGAKAEEWKNKDSRIVVFHKENGGLSDARNYGIDRCHGEYITFVDSDDWLPLDAVEYLYGILVKYDADFSMGRYVTSAEKYHQTKFIEKNLKQEDFLNLFFKVGTQIAVQHAWGKLYKRVLFDTVRYPLDIIDEDIPTTFKLALRSNKVAFSEKIIYFYYLNDTSITGSSFSKSTLDLLKAWDLVIEETEKQVCSERIKSLAVLNRIRADFGILCVLSIAGDFFRNKRIFKEEITVIKKHLRSNLKVLIKGSIPRNRKVLALAYACSFEITGTLVYLISCLLHKKIPH